MPPSNVLYQVHFSKKGKDKQSHLFSSLNIFSQTQERGKYNEKKYSQRFFSNPVFSNLQFSSQFEMLKGEKEAIDSA